MIKSIIRRYTVDIIKNERGGVENLVTLLVILPIFLVITFGVVTYSVFINRQLKLEQAHHRALQLATEVGYLSNEVVLDTQDKLEEIGFPVVTVGGVEYPDFTGSTFTKVLRGGQVRVVIKYPASDLDRLFYLIGGTRGANKGYYLISGEDRSEAFE